jgi:K+-transporting ATPase ATPase A chain
MVWLPLNPDGNPSMSGDLAFNTTIVLLPIPIYSTFRRKRIVLFRSVDVALAIHQCWLRNGNLCCFYGYERKTSETLGNFYSFFSFVLYKSFILPFIICSCILVMNGTPMTLKEKDTITTLEGKEQKLVVDRFFVALKQLGTNGEDFTV